MPRRAALSIRTKLLAAFAVSLLLMLVLGLLSIGRLGSENSHVNRLAAQVVPATQSVGDLDQLGLEWKRFRAEAPGWRSWTAPSSMTPSSPGPD